MSPTINAILKVALNPKNQSFRPQKPQYEVFKRGNLIIAVILNRGLSYIAHPPRLSEKGTLPPPQENVPYNPLPDRISCRMLGTRLSKGLPSGEGPSIGLSACPGGQSLGQKGMSSSFCTSFRIKDGQPLTRYGILAWVPRCLGELQPRPAEPRRALSQFFAICARGCLGGVYIKAQKGWSLTSAHSAAMRSFLQK